MAEDPTRGKDGKDGKDGSPWPCPEPAPLRAAQVYGRGVRTALRNNATAYGFSITITTGYGLVSTTGTPTTAPATLSFAAGATIAFVLVGALAVAATPSGSLGETGQIVTISGGIDLLSVAAAVAAAYGISRLPTFWAWPLTGAGCAAVYLLVGGLDVLVARAAARHTSFGDRQ